MRNFGITPDRRPCLFVVKKNKTPLLRLFRWLTTREASTCRRTLQGYETMSMIRKGQVEQVKQRDGKALAIFVEVLFRGVA